MVLLQYDTINQLTTIIHNKKVSHSFNYLYFFTLSLDDKLANQIDRDQYTCYVNRSKFHPLVAVVNVVLALIGTSGWERNFRRE